MPTTPESCPLPRTSAPANHPRPVHLDDIALPHSSLQLSQDEEWAVVRRGNTWQRVRLHDYDEIFAIPGLYDIWVYEILQCTSPRRVRDLLAGALKEAGVAGNELTVLDLGAGNGCVAEELAKIGIERFVGVDICPNARVAALRDRPGRYQAYVIGDLCDLDDDARSTLEEHRFTALACVAALGFGDIPPGVLTAALERIEPGGWIAFTIKTEFVDRPDASPFARTIESLKTSGDLRIVATETYVHRVDSTGAPIRYTAFVGRWRE